MFDLDINTCVQISTQHVTNTFIMFSCHTIKEHSFILVSFHTDNKTRVPTHTRTSWKKYATLTYMPYMLKLSNLHSHLHSCSLHRKKIGCALFQSQSTFISAVNVNWRAVLRKQKTHFLKLTRFHRFGCFPFSLVFSGSFLLFDKRWVFPVLSLQALMGKVCAWHCVVFRQRKCVLLCAILLSTCGNKEQGGKRHTFDRQEWYYDILMCSTARKYSLCLHFLFWRFWHFLGIAMFCFFPFLLKRDFLLLLRLWCSHTDIDRANRKQNAKLLSVLLCIAHSHSLSFSSIYHSLHPSTYLTISINLSCLSL